LKPLSDATLATAVLDDARDFAALEEEWEDLYHNSPLATPFQSWGWLYSWWEHYGEDHELRLITVRDGGLLVGLVPLMLARRAGLGKLLFIGTGPTDYLDVLVREGWEAGVSEAVVRALGQIDSWQVADLQMLRPEAASWSVLGRWGRYRARIWQEACPVVEIKPWEELLKSLSSNHRSTIRRALRRAEADGVRRGLVGADDAEQAAARLVAVSREQWRGNPLTGPEHWSRRFEAHVKAVARRMTACGLGAISEFRRDGDVIVSTLLVFGRNFVGTYMIGASPEAARRYQWSSLYIWDATDIARSRGSSHLDLLQGVEPYKLRWSSGTVDTSRLVLGRNPVSWGLYSGYHALRSRGKRFARSDHAPGWAGQAADRYRVLRNEVRRLASRTQKKR
jgi:CelD/BcsL family acetyltransferase involved in cellulose biosynthesis